MPLLDRLPLRVIRASGLLAVLTISVTPSLSAQTKPLSNGEKAPASRVPFVACKSDGQAGPVPPPPETEKIVELDASVAKGLAYYESGVGRGVLAPRGWFCFGVYGSSGSALLVRPEPIDSFSGYRIPLTGPVVEVNNISGATSGRFEVARVVARVFPQYKAFVQDVIKDFDFFEAEITYGPYPTDTLSYKGEQTVQYRTPANMQGLGTMTGRLAENDDPIEGVAFVEGEPPELLLLRVRLPPEMRVLTPHIISGLGLESRNNPR